MVLFLLLLLGVKGITRRKIAHIQRLSIVLTIKSGLLTSFSNTLFTLFKMSNMAVSKASEDPFRSGSASVMYLNITKGEKKR